MTAPRTFELTIDGETFYCLAFPSPAEREQAMADASVLPVARIEPERPRGRPSFDAVLAEAVAALQLDPAQSLASRARAVLRHLAASRDASEIPSRRTVETFLAGEPARKKSRNKSRRYSRRGKLTAVGE